MEKKYSQPDEKPQFAAEPQLAAEPQTAFETAWTESDVLEAETHQSWQMPLSEEKERMIGQLDKTPSLPGGLSTAAAAHILLQVAKNRKGRTFDELWQTAAPFGEVREKLLASIGV